MAVPRVRYFLRRMVWLVLAVSLPLMGLQLFALWQGRQAAQEQAFERVRTQAEDTAKAVRATFEHAERFLMFLASRARLGAMNVQACQQLLRGVADLDPAYANLLIIGADGHLVCSSLDVPPPDTFFGRPWFERALTTGEFVLGDPQVGRLSNRQVSVLARRVEGVDGHVLGVAAIALDLVRLAEVLPSAALPERGTVAVIKSDAVVMTRAPEPERWIGAAIPAEMSQKRAASPSGVILGRGLDGVERAYASHDVRPDVRVAVGVPLAPIMAAVSAETTRDLQATIAITAWGLLGAVFGARRLARPLHSIADTTRQFAQGDRSARADESLPGEFGEVARELNQLVERRDEALQLAQQSEQRALRLSRFYEALSSTNQVLTREPAPQLLYDEVCRICVATRLADMAWIGIVGEDRKMRAVAWGGRAGEYAGDLVIDLDDPAQQGGPTARAIATGQPVTSNRYRDDADTAYWHQRAQRFGVRASAAIPIRCEGGCVGSLNLYVGQVDYFDAEMLGLLTSMANDIALGLGAHGRREAREALREAQAANLAKSTFLSRVSHELRTPLNAILGFTQLLQGRARPALDAQSRAQLDNVLTAARQLKSLIDDVMDVSRIETGQMALNIRPVHVEALLADVVAMCEPQSARAGVRLQSLWDAGGRTVVESDAVRLRQIVLNLLTNAVKYNRPGGTASVSLAREGDQLRITVADTGIGMSADQVSRLFQPFERLGREGTAIEGSGIGLSLTRQLVELFAGTLTVESEEGVGTSVSVRLPASRRGVDEGGTTVPSELDAMLPPPADVCGRVLYIEDNEVNALLLQELMTQWPRVELTVAGTGRQGLEAVRTLKPDLVLLDMHLPDMTGLDVLSALRQDERTRGLRVIALSASALPQDVEQARAAGVDDYWTKPIDFGVVTRGIEAALGEVPRTDGA